MSKSGALLAESALGWRSASTVAVYWKSPVSALDRVLLLWPVVGQRNDRGCTCHILFGEPDLVPTQDLLVGLRDIVAGHDLRHMLRLTQAELAGSLGISVDSIRNWEQDRCQPDGPARVLIRLLSTRPGLILRMLKPVA